MCTNKHYYCMFNGITVTTSYIIDEEYKEYIKAKRLYRVIKKEEL